MRSKRRNQRRHALRRAHERYGLHLSTHDLEDARRRIQRGDAQLVEKQSNRVSVFELAVQGQACRVVYDRQRKTLVTFLPQESEDPHVDR